MGRAGRMGDEGAWMVLGGVDLYPKHGMKENMERLRR